MRTHRRMYICVHNSSYIYIYIYTYMRYRPPSEVLGVPEVTARQRGPWMGSGFGGPWVGSTEAVWGLHIHVHMYTYVYIYIFRFTVRSFSSIICLKVSLLGLR